MKTKGLFAIFTLLFLITNAKGQTNTENDDNVIVQMNYCINTLTNIIHNKSMDVLEHESDQLINNLTMEQIVGLYDVQEFRVELMDAVSKFTITEEERLLMRRIQSIKKDNMKWLAISNALSPTMLLTGGGGGGGGGGTWAILAQLVYQTLLTVARSAVEYKTMQGEQNIEELQAMWELRKADLEKINNLRIKAYSIVFNLYNKYNLKEYDRLTESTANLFNEYVSVEDADKRIRVLEDNVSIYNHIPEYYYHLGMAYLDRNNYKKAKLNFTKYLEMYSRTPFLRYDERSGCIALAILANEKDLSASEKKELIKIAIKNMPNNSAAVLQCALTYIYDLGLYEDGFQLLRSGIDNTHASDRELLYMAIANLLPLMKEYPSIYNAISITFENSKDKGFDSYVTYLINNGTDVWEHLNKLNTFSNCYYRPLYFIWLKKFSANFHLTLPSSVAYNSNDFYAYAEIYRNGKLYIHQLKAKNKYAITEDDINEVKCFKDNKNLKYLYVETIEPGIYKLKQNIDIDKIKDKTWPRQSEFDGVLVEDDFEDIIDFCEKNMPESEKTELIFKKVKRSKQILKSANNKDVKFYGDTLAYTPYAFPKQYGHRTHIRIILKNGMQLVYEYNNKEEILQPYFYSDTQQNYFWNEDAEIEYNNYQIIDDPLNESSWFSRKWSSVKGWFSSDEDSSTTESNENETTIEQDEKSTDEDVKSSWFSRMWSSVKGWFSSDEDSSTTESDENETTIEQDEKSTDEDVESSWFSRMWSSVKGWFSSDENAQ